MWFRTTLIAVALIGCSGDDGNGNKGDKGGDCDQLFPAFLDEDGDGFGDALTGEVCSLSEGEVAIGGDCDDSDPDVHPDVEEICDGLDNNCNDVLDEGLQSRTFYFDGDGDTYGDSGMTLAACASPGAEWVDNDEDCDDTQAGANPDGVEVCNDGIDDDCNGLADDEDPAVDRKSQVDHYPDLDGDGYGDQTEGRPMCAPRKGWITVGGDCNDNNVDMNPLANEVCDGFDNNCDGLPDELDPLIDLSTYFTVFTDDDGDGDGVQPEQEVCRAVPGVSLNEDDCDDTDPTLNAADNDGDGSSTCEGDCNDNSAAATPDDLDGDGFNSCGDGDCSPNNAAIFPGAIEICNGVDDNCDAQVDDDDPTLDLSTAVSFFIDGDGDGDGDPGIVTLACAPYPGISPTDTDCDDTDDSVDGLDSDGDGFSSCDGDCNDNSPLETLADVDGDGFDSCGDGDCGPTNPNIFPGATETVADGLDQDCDGTELCYVDSDLDGLGSTLTVTGSFACGQAGESSNDGDCDDNDDAINGPVNWHTDADGDGYGDGAVIANDCIAPNATAVEIGPLDCDDSDPLLSPGGNEICLDGIDQDCDGFDECTSCAELLESDPVAVSGTYALTPVPGGATFDLYCDMDVDGGGWTLVASTAGTPLADQASGYHTDLTTVVPASANPGVWAGLRGQIQDTSDVRFACKLNAADVDMEVDLSFYDVPWYREFTTGTDAQSCFSEADGAGYDVVPARTDNISGAFLPIGNDWNAGYLEGEDACGDATDFTVDFDDRGKDSDQSDGTDWGEDDGAIKCGASGVGDAWFILVRE